MKNSTLRGLAALTLAALPFTHAAAQSFTENFDNITLLAGGGWSLQNVSTPVGSTGWTQGPDTGGGGPFNSYNGATNAYISANYNNTGSTGTISNWLVSPNRTLRNGDVITFFTRKATPDNYPDRLEVRLSTNGASTNVGTGTGVGDFTTLLLSINPILTTGVYPTAWTQYTITVSGLSAPTSGRFAFRYFVTGGGSLGTNSDFIGIDNVVYTQYVCPTITVSPATLSGGAAGVAYNTSLSQTGALGAPGYSVTAGALPPGLTLSAGGTISGTPTATGTFNFTIMVSDASGCSGSQSYSITTVCGPNPTTLNGLPALCSNGTPVTLTQGSPAGGTYSGVGVTGSSFDPAAGTQTITYGYTDPYGCAYSTSNPITVNTAPSVSQSAIPDMCDNGSPAALSGGSPAGGTYSGTGVSAGMFDPSFGSQTVTYTYTNGNGCTNTTSTSITVNTAPVVSHQPATYCADAGIVTITGAIPSGGTYSGTGVSGNTFDVASGTQTINYDYTDGNGCTSGTSFSITVNPLPSVSQSAFPGVCEDAGLITLSGGAPAGGVYSGVGVAGTSFDPSAGTQTITYTYTDANGCTNSASQPLTVNALPNTALTLPVTMVCVYDNAMALSGGSPASGTYSGAGVTAGSFDPATAGTGTHTITYSYTDGNGCAADATDDIVVDDCLGVEENTVTGLTAYPNPGTGNFTITLNDSQELKDIVVTDAQGKLVNDVVSQQGMTVTINLVRVQNGIYFLKGTLDGISVSVRLIKQ